MKARFLSACLVCLTILAFIVSGPNSVRGLDATGISVPAESESDVSRVFLPLTFENYVSPSGRLCRFGVGGWNLGSYQVNTLRVGWYLDWGAAVTPVQPGGIDYMPMVRLTQTGLDSFSYSPPAPALLTAITARPGSVWIIGNEPDCIWQDDLEPHVYARAYHELYHLIKTADPTARIAAGSIVQPTPLRLKYLDMVLDSYKALYGAAMPVDIWNTHAFILREEAGGWGAEIPRGIDVQHGELYEIDDNDNIAIFKQGIRSFRRWMADNGYRDTSLIITEFGVQMPPDFGFPPERVKAFMDASFDFMLTESDPSTGHPEDGNRLVQQWAWYSVSDNNFNGWLFDPTTKVRTVHGGNFAAYTKLIKPTVNLTPVAITATPTRNALQQVIGTTLHVRVVNNGNISAEGAWKVSAYLGDPNSGGTLIGHHQVGSPLGGCAAATTVDIVWDGVSSGSHSVTVVVDPDNRVVESNELDNLLTVTIDLGR
jgi:hypothetical protein